MRISSIWNRACYAALLVAGALFLPNATQAAEPIRVGLSMALTGSVAPIGKQVLTALQIWRDDVNAKGGLLGRPVELVFYDDQSNPTNIPQLYTKLINVDKVDLLIGPYATNMVAPAIPVLMQFKKLAARIAGLQRANHLLGAAIAGRSCNITDATPKVIAVAKVRANIVIHICSSIAWQAGARPVSQPSAPGTEPQPMIHTACAYY